MATGPIATFATLIGGSGYKNGIYKNVALSGGVGTGAAANLTVSGTAVSACTLPHLSTSAQLDRVGKNYQIGDTLTVNSGFDGVGSGSGFSVLVGTLAQACENCLYGKIVPPSAGPNLFGQRYCGNAAYDNQNSKLFALSLLAGRAPYQNDASTITSHSWEALICQDDYFCGDGADLASGLSFSTQVTGLPQVGVLKVKVLSIPGVTMNSSATVVVTGAGFKPKGLVLFGTYTPNATFSIGFADGGSVEFASTTGVVSGATVLNVDEGAGASCAFTLVSFDTDGFTLLRAPTGSPAGVTNLGALCLG